MVDEEENVFLQLQNALKHDRKDVWEEAIQKLENYPLAQWISSGGYSNVQLEKILDYFNPAYNINENILHLHAINGLHDQKGKEVSDGFQCFFDHEKERVGLSQFHQYFGTGLGIFGLNNFSYV